MNKTWSVIIAVLITAAIGVGGAYYYLNAKAAEEKAELQEQIDELNDQIASLQSQSSATDEPIETATEDETVNWQTYTNEEYGFTIKYPLIELTGSNSSGSEEEWVSKEVQVGGTLAYVAFGPPSSAQGGYVWGVTVKDGSLTTIDRLISSQGDQFSDRKESKQNIIINGHNAMLVTVTTGSVPNWVSRVVYTEKDSLIFEISNGAIDDDAFNMFYRSLKFTY